MYSTSRTLSVASIMIALLLPAHAQNSAPPEKIDGTLQKSSVGERKSYALVIGMDKYLHPDVPKLTKAVRDARTVRAALEIHGFAVTLRTDVVGAELARIIAEWFLDKGQDPQARLLFWYAGHGETLTVGGQERGYLVPIDAPPKTQEVAFKLQAYPLSRLRTEILPNVKARHVLAIFDSCFSGMVFQQRSGPREAEDPATYDNPVRHIITSGTRGQTVADDGEFRRFFVEALTQADAGADADGNGYLTGYELGQYLVRRMKAINSAQTPISAPLPSRGEATGEFYFHTHGSRGLTPPKGPAAPRLSEIVRKCIIGTRHAYGPHLATELVKSVDLKTSKLVHTWRDVPASISQKSSQAAAPHDVYRITRLDDEIHLLYPGGELVVVPVIDPNPVDAKQAQTTVLLQGGWRQRSGDGCVEFRFDTQTLSGEGKWWIKKRYRYIPNPFDKSAPQLSELKVVPR